MSERKKYHRADALAIAEELQAMLAPACERIAIAGSLRREKQQVGDIEICFVPRVIQEPDGLFYTRSLNATDRVIDGWLASGIVSKRLAATGKISAWGPLNKHAVHAPTGIGVDLFSEPDIRDWPRSLCIRTGPKDFNVRLMESARHRKLNAHAYGEALHRVGNGQRVFAETEREFIELCGVAWAEPKDRR